MTFTQRAAGPSFHPPAATIKGIPTQEELDALPHNYTWEKLQWIISSKSNVSKRKADSHRIRVRLAWQSEGGRLITCSDLGHLKREPSLQQRYELWCDGIVDEHKSIGTDRPQSLLMSELYLKTVRLPWPAHELVLPESIETPDKPYVKAYSLAARSNSSSTSDVSAGFGGSVKRPSGDEAEEPRYLRWTGELDPDLYSVLRNDWPYNVPLGVEHCCVWSKVSLRSSISPLADFAAAHCASSTR